jgi:DNA-binding MarR family transcriptional regulator
LALIDSLLKNADETTTAIVATFLAHPKPTATAIAKELGLDHKQVTRALNRLAGKFSTKQYGDYHEYLVAL